MNDRPRTHQGQDDHAHCGHASAAPAATAGGDFDKVPPGYSGPLYTCPMHPQVRQTSAGSCPICGMGLELESAAMGDDGPNPELVDFTRRFWIGAIFTVPLLAVTMVPYLGLRGLRDVLGERRTL